MCLVRSMFQQLDLFTASRPQPEVGIADIVRAIAEHSARPRYTFMVLDLITRVARANGEAGPLVREGGALVPIREWLAAAIAPSGARHHQRRATTVKVKAALAATGGLPAHPADIQRIVEAQVAERIRETGMTAVSRAVSELVRADLIKRHYQGFCIDHENRGAQRLAVYTVMDCVRAALRPECQTSENQKRPYVRPEVGSRWKISPR